MIKWILALGIVAVAALIVLALLSILNYVVAGLLVTATIGIVGWILSYVSKQRETSVLKRGKDTVKGAVVPEEVLKSKQIIANETVSIKKKEFQQYIVMLKRDDVLKGEINADAPINIYFMDGLNFDKYFRDKGFDYEYSSENFWEGSIEYFAPRKAEWSLILENEGKEPVKVKVYLYV
jgi:hypothetical protein